MGLFDFLFGKKKTPSSPEPQHKTQPKPSRPKPAPAPKAKGVTTFDTAKLQGIDLGGGFTLVPLDMGFLADDKFPIFATLAHGTPNLAKWLPGFDLSTPETVVKYLRACVLRTEMDLGFTYLIKMRGGVIGMIFVNTPTYNETTIGFPNWTVDFFLVGIVQGKGLMPNMLLGLSFYLKDVLHIPEIYAIVDERNTQCMKMMDNCLFFPKAPGMVFTDPSTGNKAVAFRCDLKSLESPY